MEGKGSEAWRPVHAKGQGTARSRSYGRCCKPFAKSRGRAKAKTALRRKETESFGTHCAGPRDADPLRRLAYRPIYTTLHAYTYIDICMCTMPLLL